MIQPVPFNLFVNDKRTTVVYYCPKCVTAITDGKAEKKCSNCSEEFDWSNLKMKTSVEFANKYFESLYRLPVSPRVSVLLAEVLKK